MPPWRTSRGLVLGLLTCLSLTLVTAESVATPAQGDEADNLPAQKLNAAAAPGEGAATPWVKTPKRTVTVTPQSDVLTKKASVVEQGPKKASLKRLSRSRRDQTSPSNNKEEAKVKVDALPQRTGLVVVLVLLLFALLVTLTGAWCKLREYGGTGAYYPWQMETGAHGTRRWARILRSFLPGRASSQRGDPEAEDQKIMDDENEGEDEEDEEEPGSEDEEEEEEGGSKLRKEGDSLSDYSSLGGIDLRERAGAVGGGDEESLPPPSSSPRGSQVLGGLHSLAGSAPWGETGQDVTAL
ncbi:uncharacterized protein LOC134341793 [Mobula hypostoma]|uniref:uncharacterized protein LOC134341793 n=1 Tax=Mobula hypostoma TaxID=723540 RepID=UPI002FC2F72B